MGTELLLSWDLCTNKENHKLIPNWQLWRKNNEHKIKIPARNIGLRFSYLLRNAICSACLIIPVLIIIVWKTRRSMIHSLALSKAVVVRFAKKWLMDTLRTECILIDERKSCNFKDPFNSEASDQTQKIAPYSVQSSLLISSGWIFVEKIEIWAVKKKNVLYTERNV